MSAVPAMPAITNDALLMDIGTDLGALVVYAPPGLAGQEVEVVPADWDGGHPRHNVVRPRRVAGGEVVYAAVFPDLPAGDYRPFGGWSCSQGRLRVTAGQVLETTWEAHRWLSQPNPRWLSRRTK